MLHCLAGRIPAATTVVASVLCTGLQEAISSPVSIPAMTCMQSVSQFAGSLGLQQVLTCTCSLCIWWQDCSIRPVRRRVVEGGLLDLQDSNRVIAKGECRTAGMSAHLSNRAQHCWASTQHRHLLLDQTAD
jgi:hypothetical protein